MSIKGPSHRKDAINEWNNFIGRRMNGSRTSKARHKDRMKVITGTLYKKYQVNYDQYKCKHFRSIIENYWNTKDTNKTHLYFRTIYHMVCLLDKENDWMPRLFGPWCTKNDLPTLIKGERRPNPTMK